MEERKDPMILTAASIIFLLLLLGYAKMVSGSGSEGDKLLEGLTPTAAGYCLANDELFYPCVKYIKEGEVGFFILAILSADAKEVLYIFRVEGAAQTMVWQKGLRL